MQRTAIENIHMKSEFSCAFHGVNIHYFQDHSLRIVVQNHGLVVSPPIRRSANKFGEVYGSWDEIFGFSNWKKTMRKKNILEHHMGVSKKWGYPQNMDGL